ncbi:MAG: hypothetical protein WBC83_00560 [Minisyncoccia bacterium]
MKSVKIKDKKKNKKVKVKKLDDIKMKDSDDAAIMDISLCLSAFMEGLHMHLSIAKEAEAHVGLMSVFLHGKHVGLFDVEWDEGINPEDGGLEIFAEVIRGNELAE